MSEISLGQSQTGDGGCWGHFKVTITLITNPPNSPDNPYENPDQP